MATPQFYTYLHCKPDGEPFYVGKGIRSTCKDNYTKRSHNFTKRNAYHKNIVAKYGKENIGVFVFPCESEEQAFLNEIQQIAQLRRDGYELCNLTDGGEGSSGRKGSEKQKEAVRKIMLERVFTPEMRSNYRAGQKNRLPPDEKERIRLKGMAALQKKMVECITLNTVFDSVTEAAEQLNLLKTSISKVCRGSRNSVYGLKFNYI